MVNKSYVKGYNFQRRVKLFLESLGYVVITSAASKFPDGVALRNAPTSSFPKFFLYECKVNKYLSSGERSRASELMRITGLPFLVFYRNGKTLLWQAYSNEPKTL